MTERMDVETFRKLTRTEPMKPQGKPVKESEKKKLENAFLAMWRAMKPESWPDPVREYRFHPVRMWRLDFAFVDLKVAIEVQGGTFMGGKGAHSRGPQQHKDYEKLNTAQALGWRVFQFDAKHLGKSMIADSVQFVIDAILSIEAHS